MPLRHDIRCYLLLRADAATAAARYSPYAITRYVMMHYAEFSPLLRLPLRYRYAIDIMLLHAISVTALLYYFDIFSHICMTTAFDAATLHFVTY